MTQPRHEANLRVPKKLWYQKKKFPGEGAKNFLKMKAEGASKLLGLQKGSTGDIWKKKTLNTCCSEHYVESSKSNKVRKGIGAMKNRGGFGKNAGGETTGKKGEGIENKPLTKKNKDGKINKRAKDAVHVLATMLQKVGDGRQTGKSKCVELPEAVEKGWRTPPRRGI